MDKRELAEFYMDRVLEDLPGLTPSSLGAVMMALIRACDDLQREKQVLHFVLSKFIETDSGKALSTFRQALNASSPASTREDATGAERSAGDTEAREGSGSATGGTAPQASSMAMSDPLDGLHDYLGPPPSRIQCPSCDGRASYLTGFSKDKPAVIVCHEDNCGYRETR